MYHEIDHSYFFAFDARPDVGLLLKPTRNDDHRNTSDYYDDKCSGEPDVAAHWLQGQ